jgi:hypothetical protein
VERREEALQQRILELKRRICRQRAATQRRLASASAAPGRPSLAAASSLSASSFSGDLLCIPGLRCQSSALLQHSSAFVLLGLITVM